MVLNFNRKSDSSDSRKARRSVTAFSTSAANDVSSSEVHTSKRLEKRRLDYHAIRGNRPIPSSRTSIGQRTGNVYGEAQKSSFARTRLSSVRIGDLDRVEHRARAGEVQQRSFMIVVGIFAAIVALLICVIAVYFSNAFAIEEVRVSGVEHLTATEMTALAAVPSNTTLLRVDTAGIKARILKDAWIESVNIKRSFPHSLEIVASERDLAAVVEITSSDALSSRLWAIASDGMWLMPIPDEDSEEGALISRQIYTDVGAAVQIIDVAYGTDAEIGTYCSDATINNVLEILYGMTTELADQVKTVRASDITSTTLVLENGVEIAFGAAEDIRVKERVCLELLSEHEGEIAYINVRVPDNPTWRSLS